MLEKLLLANAISLRNVLSGAPSHEQFHPSLIGNKLAPNPTPDVSISRYSGFVLS